jgi:hypothetical protein
MLSYRKSKIIQAEKSDQGRDGGMGKIIVTLAVNEKQHLQELS